MWQKLALLSALSKALNQVTTKILLNHTGVLEISAYGQLASAIIVFPAIFFTDTISIPNTGDFHAAAWITISLNVIAIVLLVEAIRRSDLSYAVPFLSLTPVFTILTAWAIRGEQPTLCGMIGIVIVATGALSIDAISIRDWIGLGGRRVLRDRGVWLVVVVAFIYAISSVYDKTATLLSDPLTFVWYSAISRAILLLFVLIVWRQFNEINGNRRVLKGSKSKLLVPGFIILGITFLMEAVFQVYALQTGLVAFVLAIKRLSIIITTIMGFMLFKEAFTWFRVFGAVTMVVGTAIIYQFG